MVMTSLGSCDKQRRLKKLMMLFFCAMAIPSAILVFKSLEKLQWEAYYQHRQIAEEVASRIDQRLSGLLKIEQARPFDDYRFGQIQSQNQIQSRAQTSPEAKFLGRSPIASYPPSNTFAGLVGYFQIDPDGEFSTPLLPVSMPADAQFSLLASELVQRQRLQLEIEKILTNNNLLLTKQEVEGQTEQRNSDAALSSLPQYSANESTNVEERQRAALSSKSRSDQAFNDSLAEQPESATFQSVPAQAAFDDITLENSAPEQQRRKTIRANNNLGELSKFELEAPYAKKVQARQKKEQKQTQPGLTRSQSKSFGVDENQTLGKEKQTGTSAFKKLATRQENLALLEEPSANTQKPSAVLKPSSAGSQESLVALEENTVALEQDVPVSSDVSAIEFFDSEVDPLELTLLDSGHWVLFRKVWRNGQRFIQGLLIEQEPFLSATFEQEYRSSLVSQMSQLALAYRGNVLLAYGNSVRSYRLTSARDLNGTLLYRSRMSAPFNDLEGLYTINRLPTGAGGKVIWWSAIVLALVLLLGTYIMYRLSLSNLRLVEQQQDFVSAVSHELKTPLTSIRMYGEILKSGWADQAKKQSYYNFIFDESERLTRLINNVLALARMTRNETQANLQPMTVGQVIDLIRSKVDSQIKSEGFQLRIVVDDTIEAVKVELDPDMISQVFINLVDNALKFAANSSSKDIEISAIRERNSKLSFTVRDFGPGIDDAQMKSIFKLFYRVENELTRETSGTGIGLALVNQLTRLMNGRVDVVSRDPGVEFKLTFPLSI